MASTKRRAAQKLRTRAEMKGGVSVFQTAAWSKQKAEIAARVKRRVERARKRRLEREKQNKLKNANK